MSAIALIIVFGGIYLAKNSAGTATYENFHKPFNGSDCMSFDAL